MIDNTMQTPPNIVPTPDSEQPNPNHSDRPLLWLALIALFFAAAVAYWFYRQLQDAERKNEVKLQSLTVSLQLQQDKYLDLEKKLSSYQDMSKHINQKQDSIAHMRTAMEAQDKSNKMLLLQKESLKKQIYALDSILKRRNEELWILKRQNPSNRLKR
jgi:LmbE family N-acetylglucosaminyl deacetylase